NGRKLTRHAEILLPEGALTDGMPTPLLTAAIRGALESGGFVATHARLAIAETGTAFRDFRLPAVPASELARAVMFEGRRQVPMVKGRPRFFRTFALDAPADDAEGQLEELTHALNALVKFMRGTASDVPITPATTLALGGRFAFLPDGFQRAEQRFDFTVIVPATRFTSAQNFPWQAHFAGLGLLLQARWYDRLT